MSKQNPTNLAGGQRRATFVTGSNDVNAPVELKNLSSEPRLEAEPVFIDRTRNVKQIEPLNDQIHIERRESEQVSAGGILIADSIRDQDKPAEGVIISIGPEVDNNNLQPGDRVLFGRYAGTEYPFGGETILFIREEEVIARIRE